MCILLYVKHSSLKSIRGIKEKEANNTIGIVWKGQTRKGDQGLEIPGALPPRAGDLIITFCSPITRTFLSHLGH